MKLRLPLAVAVLLAVAGGVTPAAAAPVSTDGVHVVGTADGFSAPTETRPGWTTVSVSTTNDRGIRLGLFQLRPGHTLDQLLAGLRTALTEHGTAAAAGGRQVEASALLLGGAVAAPGRAVTFQRPLAPGTYLLVDYLRVDRSNPIDVHELTVRGRPSGTAPRTACTALAMVDTADGPRYAGPTVLRSGQTVLITNRTNQLAEAIFVPVKPGTTRADVQRTFETIEAGGWPSDSPLIGLPQGAPVLSAGLAQVLTPNLAPGSYVLTTWMVDLSNGRMQAAQGMHTLLTVVAD
ncbi:hypothetical protein GCM10029976_087760 [Kribbella albertanoniae]|uniref:Uncharacterized protein n=1 Tax=Kribbella albertanoniae TaxID=1266829 RepID=A0A4R4QJ39_9ACTN|nr:hypothetical protein [Kribbella albertanoniae]TDC35313.1 hypothetical protein E1261_01940 [Kribbella albertanoniae]